MSSVVFIVMRSDYEEESFQYCDNTGHGAPLEQVVFVASTVAEAEQWIAEQPGELYNSFKRTGRYSYDIEPVECSENIINLNKEVVK